MGNLATSIETKRLKLVALSVDHSDLLFSLLSDKDHTRFLSLPTAKSKQEVRAMTEGMLGQPCCLWLISEQGSDAFVGMCGFLTDSTVPNFIYSIAQDKQKCGYVSEAASVAIEVGRRLLQTDQVELNIHSENAPSLRVAMKLGFSRVNEYKHPYPQQAEPATVYVFRRTYG